MTFHLSRAIRAPKSNQQVTPSAQPMYPTDLKQRSLRNQLKLIKQVNAQAPGRAEALNQLLQSAELRQAPGNIGHGQSIVRAPNIKRYCKNTLSKCRNRLKFGQYAKTADIAKNYAEQELAQLGSMRNNIEVQPMSVLLTDLPPAHSIIGDDESNYFSCLSDSDSDSVEFHDCMSQEYATENHAIDQGVPFDINKSDWDFETQDSNALYGHIETTLNNHPIGDSHAQKCALEALKYLLFAFSDGSDQEDIKCFSANQMHAVPNADDSTHTKTITIALCAKSPRIGKVVSTSRVPLDFALNKDVHIKLTADKQGAVTLHFDGPSFFTVKLGPETALKQCNSFNFFVRKAGANVKTMTGLEHSSSSQILALTFTPEGTVTLKDKNMPNENWSPATKQNVKNTLKALLEENIPQADQAEYFAGSAWTMACLSASTGHLTDGCTDDIPKAKSALLLKILRPLAFNSAKTPGRITWTPLPTETTLTEHIQSVDRLWDAKGEPGTIFTYKSNEVTFNKLKQ